MASLPAPSIAEQTASFVLAVYHRRETTLPGLGEAGWRMLLDLSLRHPRGVPVSSACLATGAPYTTGLRVLRALQQDGFVSRSDHPSDGRSGIITITEAGLQQVSKILGV